MYVEQYAPWTLVADAPYEREPSDWSWSKAHEWAAACGEHGVVGAMRWPEIRPFDEYSEWLGTAHPMMSEVAGVTQHLADAVNLNDWAGPGENWNGRIVSPDVPLRSSWGDGRHVTAFLRWADGGRKTVEIAGLDNLAYSVRSFNCITGEPAEIEATTAVDGAISFTVQTVANMTALYVEPVGVVPPDPPDPPDPELECRALTYEETVAATKEAIRSVLIDMCSSLAG